MLLSASNTLLAAGRSRLSYANPSSQIRASQLSTQVLFLIAVLNKPDPRNLSAI
jgi:hypothetical protein